MMQGKSTLKLLKLLLFLVMVTYKSFQIIKKMQETKNEEIGKFDNGRETDFELDSDPTNSYPCENDVFENILYKKVNEEEDLKRTKKIQKKIEKSVAKLIVNEDKIKKYIEEF